MPSPTFVHTQREAAAVSAGVDVATFNMLMDLQHRDITPEDYDTLRRLDSAVQPRTLALDQVDLHAPAWCIPVGSNRTSDGCGCIIIIPVHRITRQRCAICDFSFNNNTTNPRIR